MNGLDCFMEGFRLVRAPGLRQYVIVPTLINVLVLISLIGASVTYFNTWVDGLAAYFPDWLAWLAWLVALIVVVFGLFYLFTMIANLVASPFNALLSQRIEERLTREPVTSDIPLWAVLPRALAREVAKIWYLLPRLAGLLILSFIPVLNAISPFLWILFGAWMMAVQYADYAADNNGVTFTELRASLRAERLQSVLFGLPAYFLLAIPVVNLVLMPVAVAGGTVYWVERLR